MNKFEKKYGPWALVTGASSHGFLIKNILQPVEKSIGFPPSQLLGVEIESWMEKRPQIQPIRCALLLRR